MLGARMGRGGSSLSDRRLRLAIWRDAELEPTDFDRFIQVILSRLLRT